MMTAKTAKDVGTFNSQTFIIRNLELRKAVVGLWSIFSTADDLKSFCVCDIFHCLKNWRDCAKC
jgi:hypothetical protein